MDECIDERFLGWEDAGELDIWGRARWGDNGYYDNLDEESEGDAWRMLDNVWGGRE